MRYGFDDLKRGIAAFAAGLGRITIMEVCGTHTFCIRKYGIRQLLPENIRLVSGPGCPVCVTAQRDIAAAIGIARQKDVIFTCFGDMMRVPCGDVSLYSLYEEGRDIRIVTSPLDVLKIAEDNPSKQVVYFGIGFETTAPLTAALIEAADRMGLENLSVLSVHKTMPEAIKHLLSGNNGIDALICPGHVAAVTGSDAFDFIPSLLGKPAAVSGFEAYDIMSAILCLTGMLSRGEKKCVNMYPRAVRREGNREALRLIDKVFRKSSAVWRGLGEIEGSGLEIRDSYSKYNAALRFEISTDDVPEARGCICSQILCGKKVPTDCIHFGRTCTPRSPLGPCMVSSEGSCAAYYRYGGE
jgi:Hydrogenase formation hypA family.